jgi:6-pyruvoyltetrahydropterin/6-carboxytetrahydropterin synthase
VPAEGAPVVDLTLGSQIVEIFKEFTFEAAHRLPNVEAGHKCARLHGHSFQVSVHLTGPVRTPDGWVRDFKDISCAMSPLLDVLDHHYLNEVEGLENPTSEILAHWIWERLRPALPELSEVTVRETCNSGCVYRGES